MIAKELKMEHSYDYLILGAGMAASAAARGIRARDPRGSIGLIGAEAHPPYDRPPLTKDLWNGKKQPEDIWRDIESAHATLFPGRHATALDPQQKSRSEERRVGTECRTRRM